LPSKSLIYFSPIPWRGLYQRPQHCARHFSRTRRVLFVEPRTLYAGDPPPDEENLNFLPLPVIPRNARRAGLRRLARIAGSLPGPSRLVARRQAVRLREKLDELALEAPVLFFGHPGFFSLARLVPGARLVYDHMDDILRFGDATPALRRDLETLMREADLVNATSELLEEQARSAGARRVTRIGNGVEWDRFAGADASLPEPSSLADLPRPRVLYAGSVAEWFDWELLFALARRLPALSFPVIGPARPALAEAIRGAPANVRFFGARPYGEVPAWLSHCQAAIIPFCVTPLTAAVDPVKIYEYLAAGLPVLATPFSPEIRRLAPAVTLAEGAEAFASALERLLAAPPDPEAQRAAAAPRRWETLLDGLSAAVDAL
jgi:glycosyltransferase involved in cell wall biosynthesis